MSFEEHVANGPQWLIAWLTWMMVINLASFLFLVRWRDGRFRLGHIEAFAIVTCLIAVGFFMPWLFEQFGYVRLLGLGHIPFWTPLAIYLWTRLSHHPKGTVFGVYIRVFLATIVISLAIDYTDVARFLLGERSPM